jgi:hypothetical protein
MKLDDMPYKNIEDQREWWRARREEIRALIANAKNKPCADCNRRYPFYVMQFDHVRGKKAFTVGHGVRSVRNSRSLLEEIKKCDVVCANCHAIRTHERGYAIPRGSRLCVPAPESIEA